MTPTTVPSQVTDIDLLIVDQASAADVDLLGPNGEATPAVIISATGRYRDDPAPQTYRIAFEPTAIAGLTAALTEIIDANHERIHT